MSAPDAPTIAHLVANQIDWSRPLAGAEYTALCGKVWTPTLDSPDFPCCRECVTAMLKRFDRTVEQMVPDLLDALQVDLQPYFSLVTWPNGYPIEALPKAEFLAYVAVLKREWLASFPARPIEESA